MQKISNYILNLSAKKLALYLIIYPLILIVTHTILTVFYRKSYGVSGFPEGIIPILLTIVVACFLLPLLLWLFWLRVTTFSVKDSKLGWPKKWFHLAFGLLLFYLVFNLSYDMLVNFFKNNADDFTWILYASRETINFIGLLVCYPILCHYSARAIFVAKNKENATFSNAIGYTLLLIFIPISIPFLHNYFSPVKTEKNTLIKIYAIGLGITFFIFVIGFIAAISGII